MIYAGSLLIPFPALQKAFEEEHPGVKIESEAHGSIQVLRQVSDLHQKADVLISADRNLIPLLLYNTPAPDTGKPYADWYVRVRHERDGHRLHGEEQVCRGDHE